MRTLVKVERNFYAERIKKRDGFSVALRYHPGELSDFRDASSSFFFIADESM